MWPWSAEIGTQTETEPPESDESRPAVINTCQSVYWSCHSTALPALQDVTNPEMLDTWSGTPAAARDGQK